MNVFHPGGAESPRVVLIDETKNLAYRGTAIVLAPIDIRPSITR